MNPTAPARPCTQSWCPNLQPCADHPRKPFGSIQGRPSPAARGYGARHRLWRAAVLERDPICKHPGCKQRSTNADHIIPIRQGGARFDVANGQGLCGRHHSAKTGRETRG